MNELTSDTLTGLGLLLTLIGAWITAHAVILKQTDAIAIGIPRIAWNTDAENLTLPAVQNLIASSRAARRGLVLIAVGTGLQLLPVATRLGPPFMDWIAKALT